MPVSDRGRPAHPAARWELSLAQSGSQPTALRAAVRTFVPRWGGTWYEQVHLRFYVAISRRYFKRLIAEAS